MSLEKEFHYTDDHFQFLKAMAKKLAGIHLENTKREMVYSRVSRLMRQYHVKSFDEFCHALEGKQTQLSSEFINAITTHLTYFMREKHHFDFLKDQALPTIIAQKKVKKLRIWSAGCSTGEEAYSISFMVHECFKQTQDKDWDIKILASDIDSNAIAKAKKGCYEKDVNSKTVNEYFYQTYFNQEQDGYCVKEEYKQLVHFRVFNFMEEKWPMKGPFDIIFCRNALIYFERDIQNALINQLTHLLAIRGYLILGHSESVSPVQRNLKFIGRTIYQKIM